MKSEKLFKVQEGIYSTDKDFSTQELISLKYPDAIFTMDSAFYYHNLTDVIPEKEYLALVSGIIVYAVVNIIDNNVNTSSWIAHCINTAQVCKILATKINLDEKCAETLGLLHDYGRKFNHSFNHTIIGFEKLIDLGNVTEFNSLKQNLYANWDDIAITQEDSNLDNITIDAGNKIKVACKVKLPNIAEENIVAQTYCGRILENGTLENITIVPMNLKERDEENKIYTYEAEIEMKTGGNYGYTFRVMPKHEMLLDSANLNLVKWITK